MKMNQYLKLLLRLGLLIMVAVLFYLDPVIAWISVFVVLIPQSWLWYKRRHTKPVRKPIFDDFVREYGQPDEQIIINPMRGNEMEGAVFCYHLLGCFVMNGKLIRKAEIQSMVLKNVEQPYLPCDYEILVETNRDDYPVLYLSVGADIHWASDVLQQLETALAKR